MRLAIPMALLAFAVACSTGGPGADPSPTPLASGIGVAGSLAAPVSSSAIAVSPDGSLVAAVNPDSDSVSLVDARTLELLAEVPVDEDPRTLVFTPDGRFVLVANHGGSSVSVVDVGARSELARWPVGPMPYGIVTDGEHAYVAEMARGTVAAVELRNGSVRFRVDVGRSPAGVAMAADGLLYVTHLFSGEVSVLSAPSLAMIESWETGDTNISQAATLSGSGERLFLPQTRSNVTNENLQFDTTVFPIVNVVDTETGQLQVERRITLDTADEPVNMPFAVALSPSGATAFVVNAGSNDVSVIDLATRRGLAHIGVGANPRGVAITPDGSRIFVNNTLEGTLTVIETAGNSVESTVTVTEIPLAPDVLLGKQLFNASLEPKLSTDNWVSCAVCHFDGTHDGRTWRGFPDGPRNTPSLLGVGETLPVHWSGDLDELQDVEATVRVIQNGEGLAPGEMRDTLGEPHAGLSSDLDALASFLATLGVPPSPLALDTAAVERGGAVFEAQGCAVCHGAPLHTDRRSHDVGTGDARVERNSHGRGTSFDTPSLRGLWATAPYLHDGSAASLRDVFSAGNEHNIAAALSERELDDLVTFLRSLGG